MVECRICFAEYQDGELELHQEMCVVLLMFRCTLCNVDFVSKEGLWNHLDLQHEIVDGNKELHYQEVKAKQKLHQCVLCNDHRAYSERLYWNHVHNAHDGFFLRCSDCGEQFRSEQHKSNHEFSQCKVKDQTVASDYADLEVDRVPIKVDNMTSDCDEGVFKNEKQDSSLYSSARSEMKQPSSEDLINKEKIRSIRGSAKLNVVNDTDKNMIDKIIASIRPPKSTATKCLHCDTQYANASLLRNHIRSYHEPIECGVCGITNYGAAKARYHKILKHLEPKYECAKCLKKIHIKSNYNRHLKACQSDSGQLSPEKKQPKQRKRERSLLGHEPDSVEEIDDSECISGLSLKDTSDPEMRIENPSSEEVPCTECSHCGIKESSAVSLVCHILTHHEPVGCDICGITLPSLWQAQNHKKKAHRRSKNKCPHCSMQSSSGKSLQKHILRCKNLKIPCKFCGRMFANKRSLILHTSRRCGAKTVRNDRINISKGQGQKSVETSLSTENVLVFNEKHDGSASSTMREKIVLQSGLTKYKCYYCNTDFSYPGYLIHHLKSSHELTKCKICGMTLLGLSAPSSAPKNHRVLCHTEPRFKCPHCGGRFYEKVRYTSHRSFCESKKNASRMRSVATLKDSCKIQVGAEKISQPRVENPSVQQYRCSICEVTSTEFSYIRQHMRTSHKDGLFQCHACSKKYHNLREMEVHVAICVDRKFSCDFCGKKFKLLRSAEAHKNLYHRGSEPLGNVIVEGTDCSEEQKSNYAEEIDLEKSSEENSAQQHEGENPSSGSSNAKCPYCGKSISNKARLSRHIDKIHEPSACDICGLTFANVMKTRFHKLNTHLKQTKFECPYCPLKYVAVERYEKHLSICKSKKYTCDVCSKKFAAHRFVVKHKKMFHQDKEASKKQNQNQTEKNRHEKEVSLLHGSSGSDVHGMKEVQTSFMNMPHAVNIELKSEIKIEDTMLQEQEHQVPNEDQEKSSTSTAVIADQRKICKHPHGSYSKVVKPEDTANGIKIKEEFQEEEDEGNFIGAQRTTESSECHGIPSGPNDESLECHEAGDQIKTQSKATKNKLRIKEHNSDGSETRKSKRIRIKEEN